MRLGQLISTSLIVSSLLLSATGCVCMDRGGGCSMGSTAGPCQTGCDTCAGDGDFPAGGPLSRLVGWSGGCGNCKEGCDSCSSCKVGCGAGCGELYVDEWVNEPPTVDNCGCGECLNCGRQPVRSLFRLLWGDQYCGSCETGCDSGIDVMSPLIQDGFEPGAWSANRGCNCGGHTSAMEASVNQGTVNQGTGIEESHPAESPSPTPPVPVPDNSNVRKIPTPAPPIPKSAMRLNPATRKVVR